jgi:hypothetical protein
MLPYNWDRGSTLSGRMKVEVMGVGGVEEAEEEEAIQI